MAVPRRRGKSKAPNFTYEGPVSVIRLELDVSDRRVRRRLERQWGAVFRLRRALQRDAQHRCRAYWAAHVERVADAKALRNRLGLTRKGIEAAAKAHIEASGWMRDHLTKAVGLHVAAEVWETVDRHLFADISGRRHGPPRLGSWWDFTRIPDRARSHTKATRVWETYRLVGTLDGHLAKYRHPRLPASVCTAASAAGCAAGTSILAQPARLATPSRPSSGSWWDHGGALGVVFTGLPAGDALLPVRLPQGAGQWGHLAHFLADPSVWHKIDLVRVRDRKAPGGWRYYAHLLVHQSGYQSAATRARPAEIPTGRRAGMDANVSNLALASFPGGHPEQLVVDQIACTRQQQTSATRAAKQARARQRAFDRSRRNTNPDQYGPSVRQAARAVRRANRGLDHKQITNPGGPRAARTDGVPLRAYRHDQLSGRYQRTRVDHAAAAKAASQAKHALARDIAARIVATHGNTITVEDCSISTWARLWGKRIAVFSPGILVAAPAAECAAASGRLYRVGTRSTALSQHCPCGQRVPKTLAQRTHQCTHCGLRADRDVISAALAACVDLVDPDDPRTARVDHRLAHALRAWLASQQEREGSVNRHQPPASPDAGQARTGRHHLVASAEQAALELPPNRPGTPGRRGPSRKNSPTSCLALHDPPPVDSYDDSKEAMVREWALRFRDEAGRRASTVTRHGLSNSERVHQAAAAHWHTYRNRLAEMVSVSQLAMVNDDFARYWAEICAIPIAFITEMVKRAQADGHCTGDDPELRAVAIVSMMNQFCYVQLAGPRSNGDESDDEACIDTLATIFYRAIYAKEVC